MLNAKCLVIFHFFFSPERKRQLRIIKQHPGVTKRKEKSRRWWWWRAEKRSTRTNRLLSYAILKDAKVCAKNLCCRIFEIIYWKFRFKVIDLRVLFISVEFCNSLDSSANKKTKTEDKKKTIVHKSILSTYMLATWNDFSDFLSFNHALLYRHLHIVRPE